MATTIVYLTACLTTGLTAGVFFAYEISANGALHRLKDPAYIRAMQEINRVIKNIFFLTSFLAPVFLLPYLTYTEFSDTGSFYLLLTASSSYIVGTFAITVLGNVPLNERLEIFKEEEATVEEKTKARQAFEIPWNRLHRIRTVFSFFAFAFLLLSLLIE